MKKGRHEADPFLIQDVHALRKLSFDPQRQKF